VLVNAAPRVSLSTNEGSVLGAPARRAGGLVMGRACPAVSISVSQSGDYCWGEILMGDPTQWGDGLEQGPSLPSPSVTQSVDCLSEVYWALLSAGGAMGW